MEDHMVDRAMEVLQAVGMVEVHHTVAIEAQAMERLHRDLVTRSLRGLME